MEPAGASPEPHSGRLPGHSKAWPHRICTRRRWAFTVRGDRSSARDVQLLHRLRIQLQLRGRGHIGQVLFIRRAGNRGRDSRPRQQPGQRHARQRGVSSARSPAMDRSQVSVPWLTNRSFAEITRTSPGIMSPADSLITSPGTRSRSGISLALPSRMTVAVTWIIALSLVAAASARASCTNRSVTLSTTMHAITVPARASPVT